MKTLAELTLWWFVTFLPFNPIPTDLQCIDKIKEPKCKFTIIEDDRRVVVVWNEDQILEEIQDSLNNCEPVVSSQKPRSI